MSAGPGEISIPIPTIPASPSFLSTEAERRIAELFANIDEISFRKYVYKDASRCLEDSERPFLIERTAHLAKWLREASSSLITIELTGLFTALAYRGEAKDLAVTKKLYMKHLEGVPAFALPKACERFCKGDVGDGKFVPKVAEIRKEAFRLAESLLVERHRIKVVLAAEKPARETPEQRKAAIARYRDIVRPALKAVTEASHAPGSPKAKAAQDAKLSPEQHLQKAREIGAKPLPQLSPLALEIFERQRDGRL